MTIKKATLINGAAKYYTIIMQFVVSMILARILTPGEYGIVAVVTVFTAFFAMFSDLGFGVAYIQNKNLDANDKNSLFSFMCCVGLALFAIFFVFAYAIAWFYDSDVYIPVARLLGFNLLLTAVNVIPNAELMKQQKFLLVGVVQSIAATVAAVVAIILAYNNWSYYSIVLQSILCTAITTVTFIMIVKPKFAGISKTSIDKVLGFSAGQMGFNLINYFSRNLDNLMIGKVFGNEALGYYDKAYKLTTYPVSNFASIIGGSIQPVLAQHQDDKELVFEKFQSVFLFLLVIGSYISIAFNLSAREIILVVFGDQWEKSIVAFSYLSLSLFAQMSLNVTGAFYQVMNNTKLLAVNGLLSAGMLVGGIIVGLCLGSIESVAFCYFIGQCFNFVVVLHIMRKYLFRRSFAGMYVKIAKVLGVAAVTYIISYAVLKFIEIDSIVICMLVKLIGIWIIFVALMFAVKEQDLVLDIIRKEEK